MAQDDDSFGLPDLNYKPLEPKPETPAPNPPKVEKVEKKPEVKAPAPAARIQSPGNPTRVITKPAQEEEKSSSSVLVGILVPILILVGGYFAYVY